MPPGNSKKMAIPVLPRPCEFACMKRKIRGIQSGTHRDTTAARRNDFNLAKIALDAAAAYLIKKILP
jgi:hypothetical protein